MPPFNPEDFLEVGTRVLSSPDLGSEAFIRTAIGRAYYAAHLFARETLLAQHRIERDRKGKTRHGAVIRALNKPGTEFAANALDSLMTLREGSDYDLQVGIRVESVREAMQLARLVMDELRMPA